MDGICGSNSGNGKITRCYNTGNISALVDDIGGITGTAQIGECIDCKWYSKDLNYGIGNKESNEGAIYDENLTVSELIKILE